jgi:thiosulfate dehydrogenase (quinone)
MHGDTHPVWVENHRNSAVNYRTEQSDPTEPYRTSADLFAATGVAALSIRLVQGFIFWAGASRRLFYDIKPIDGAEYAEKLDPHVSGFMASKLIHAMPGSLFPGLIEAVAQNAGLLLFMVWLWTLVELIVGAGLLLGLATRFLAFVSVLINIPLMLIFGWMGSTCVDEWTMAAAGFAMGATLMVTGGGRWSLDHLILSRRSSLVGRKWFRALFSGPFTPGSTSRWGIGLGITSFLFTVVSYQLLHGAVISPLHAAVSFKNYDVAITEVQVVPSGALHFKAYIDAGPDTGKLHIVKIALRDGQGHTLAEWAGDQLAALPKQALNNTFHQPWASRFTATPYGLSGVTGAKAVINLPAAGALGPIADDTVRLTDIDGKHYDSKPPG